MNSNLLFPHSSFITLHCGALALSALGAVTTAVGTVFWGSCDPRSSLFGPVRWRGPDTVRKRVALTFDDGPTPGATDLVLNALAALNVPAAFFVIGRNARQWPELVKRMHDEGHLVANHSFDHSHTGYLRGGKYWDQQMADTDRTVEQIIGQKPTLFRPPIGIRTPRLMGALRRSGHLLVTWSRRGLDGVDRTPEYIRDRLVGPTRPGEILVLHDGIEPGGHRNPAATVAAVPLIVAGLRERGFEFVRVDDLLQLSQPVVVEEN